MLLRFMLVCSASRRRETHAPIDSSPEGYIRCFFKEGLVPCLLPTPRRRPQANSVPQQQPAGKTVSLFSCALRGVCSTAPNGSGAYACDRTPKRYPKGYILHTKYATSSGSDLFQLGSIVHLRWLPVLRRFKEYVEEAQPQEPQYSQLLLPHGETRDDSRPSLSTCIHAQAADTLLPHAHWQCLDSPSLGRVPPSDVPAVDAPRWLDLRGCRRSTGRRTKPNPSLPRFTMYLRLEIPQPMNVDRWHGRLGRFISLLAALSCKLHLRRSVLYPWLLSDYLYPRADDHVLRVGLSSQNECILFSLKQLLPAIKKQGLLHGHHFEL
ncbi:hypothetical protein LXA43DRAFT_58412 [Ganoderma leucocontextum]|nr:hypothetical protein LXA43DRAFT_58412 [Ganoderma leucocontextum]